MKRLGAWRGFTFAFFLTRNRDRNFRKHPGVLFTYSKNEYHILLIGNCQLSVTCMYYLGSVFFIYAGNIRVALFLKGLSNFTLMGVNLFDF